MVLIVLIFLNMFTQIDNCIISKVDFQIVLVCQTTLFDSQMILMNETVFNKIHFIYFNLNTQKILDNNFLQYVQLLQNFNHKFQTYKFRNLLGFDLDLFLKLGSEYSNFYSFLIYDSKIQFFNRSSKLEFCKQISVKFSRDYLLFIKK